MEINVPPILFTLQQTHRHEINVTKYKSEFQFNQLGTVIAPNPRYAFIALHQCYTAFILNEKRKRTLTLLLLVAQQNQQRVRFRTTKMVSTLKAQDSVFHIA